MEKARKTTYQGLFWEFLKALGRFSYLFFCTLFCTFYFALLIALSARVFAQDQNQLALSCKQDFCQNIYDFEEELIEQGKIYYLPTSTVNEISDLISHHLKKHLKSNLGILLKFSLLEKNTPQNNFYDKLLNIYKYDEILSKIHLFSLPIQEKVNSFHSILSYFKKQYPNKSIKEIIEKRVEIHNNLVQELLVSSIHNTDSYHTKYKVTDFYNEDVLLEELVIHMETSIDLLVQVLKNISQPETLKKLNKNQSSFINDVDNLLSYLNDNRYLFSKNLPEDLETKLIEQTIEKTLRLIRENMYLFSKQRSKEYFNNLFQETKERVFLYYKENAKNDIYFDEFIKGLTELKLLIPYDGPRYLTAFINALKVLIRTDTEKANLQKNYQTSLIDMLDIPLHPYDSSKSLLTYELSRILYSFDYRQADDKFINFSANKVIILGADATLLSDSNIRFIMAHEIGHFVLDFFQLKEEKALFLYNKAQDENKAPPYKSFLGSTFTCLKLVKQGKEDQSTLNEDYADLLAAKISPAGLREFACLNFKYWPSNLNLTLFHTKETQRVHSTPLFRLLYGHTLTNSIFPLSCLNYLKNENITFPNCLLKD